MKKKEKNQIAAGWQIVRMKVPPTHMIIGSIVMWGLNADVEIEDDDGNTVETWMVCDGRNLSEETYRALYRGVEKSGSGIYHTFGAGYGSDGQKVGGTFNIPDLRGRFVRGTDEAGHWGAAGRDLDTKAREAMQKGGNAGDSVGSIQQDELRSHDHGIRIRYCRAGDDLHGAVNTSENSHVSTWKTGGKETRPVNAYLNFLMRVA